MAPDSKRVRWLSWLPVVILMLGVVAQAVLMQTINANPQAGSGFTMFSTVDFTTSRQIIAIASNNGSEVQLFLPDSLTEPGTALLREPTNTKATAFAETLQSLRWTIGDDGLARLGDGQEFDQVSVVVRGLDADGRTLRSELLASGQS